MEGARGYRGTWLVDHSIGSTSCPSPTGAEVDVVWGCSPSVEHRWIWECHGQQVAAGSSDMVVATSFEGGAVGVYFF